MLTCEITVYISVGLSTNKNLPAGHHPVAAVQVSNRAATARCSAAPAPANHRQAMFFFGDVLKWFL